MTWEEFLRMPQELGWKYEYADGYASIGPRHLAARLRAPVLPWTVPDTDCLIRPLTYADAPQLVRAFTDGFRDTVEYCDRSVAQVRWAGRDAVATFFAGRRGAFHSASCLAIPSDKPYLIAGAALMVQKPDGPFLDMLFVRPRWHRRGLATALVGTVMNSLHDLGESFCGSAYNVANTPSIAWHHKFGFVEQPDLLLVRARAQHLRHELWRRTQINDLDEAQQRVLETEITHWDRLGAALMEQRLAAPAAATGLEGSSRA